MNGGAGEPRVLVTGANGFLGRNVLAALAARNDVEAIAACRTPSKLLPSSTGEVRAGDLRDPRYRRDVVTGIDVVCHAGTWSSFWGHEALERTNFFEPARDLIEASIHAGVGRFLLASTVVIADPPADGSPVDDFSPTRETGFWPHLDRLVPYPMGHAFGWLMEALHPVVPGHSPFLTRSLVHVARDWFCPSDYAAKKLGYEPRKDWRTAVRETLTSLRAAGYPWPRLVQEA